MWPISHLPISGRHSWPAAKGSSNCAATSSSALRLKPAPCEVSSSATRAGVTTMPKRLDTEALHSAAGTLPRAIEVKAIDDCTVDGSRQTKSRPSARSGGSQSRAARGHGEADQRKQNEARGEDQRLQRQCIRPSTTACGDSRAP